MMAKRLWLHGTLYKHNVVMRLCLVMVQFNGCQLGKEMFFLHLDTKFIALWGYEWKNGLTNLRKQQFLFGNPPLTQLGWYFSLSCYNFFELNIYCFVGCNMCCLFYLAYFGVISWLLFFCPLWTLCLLIILDNWHTINGTAVVS